MIRPAAAADVSELLWKRYRIEVLDDHEPDVAAWQTWMRRRIAAGDARVGVVEREIVAYTVWQRRRAKTIMLDATCVSSNSTLTRVGEANESVRAYWLAPSMRH